MQSAGMFAPVTAIPSYLVCLVQSPREINGAEENIGSTRLSKGFPVLGRNQRRIRKTRRWSEVILEGRRAIVLREAAAQEHEIAVAQAIETASNIPTPPRCCGAHATARHSLPETPLAQWPLTRSQWNSVERSCSRAASTMLSTEREGGIRNPRPTRKQRESGYASEFPHSSGQEFEKEKATQVALGRCDENRFCRVDRNQPATGSSVSGATSSGAASSSISTSGLSFDLRCVLKPVPAGMM